MSASQILPSPPPHHPLFGLYDGRLLIHADGSETLLDRAAVKDEDAVNAAGYGYGVAALTDGGYEAAPRAE